ncbi:MAG: hypothetical protein QQN41_00085 [Nitrosopumilus sp.]
MGDQGLTSPAGPASPPYRNGPYNWDQFISFNGGIGGSNTKGKHVYVDGTNGSDSAKGTGWGQAFKTIQKAITSAKANGVVYVIPKAIAEGETDPASYEENLIIPATHENLSIIGISTGRTQGGLPQLKDGDGTTVAILIIRSPGCLIANIGFNGAGNTGGGILLDDDSSTKVAFGTSIIGCHFKNCKGHATDGRLGGAIMWSSEGGAWQVLISGNRFYKNVADIVLLGTSGSRPQDVVIENNDFSGPGGSVDVNIYLAAGSGMDGVTIKNNTFQQLPAIGSGSVVRYIDTTGCVGMLIGNTFGCQTNPTGGTVITFKATGTGGKIPTTMHLVANYGQSINSGETGIITIA